MKIFTSDLHFSHRNIVKFTNRGVDTGQDHHDEWLIGLWNSQVSRSDEVWHLGDFSFTKKYDEVAEVVSKLKGQKHFLKGNHDDRKILERLKTDGLICNWHDYKEIKFADTTACLFHFPIKFWHKQGYGSVHLHGHLHGSPSGLSGKVLDVGLDSSYNMFGEHRFFSEEFITQHLSGLTNPRRVHEK